jgi:3',5'-cyclic AMP phosphodiesterase CpdA
MQTWFRCFPVHIPIHALVLLGACHEPPGQGSPAPEVADSVFTIAVLPDTQAYTEDYPAIFESQTAWLAREKDSLNLAMVVHEGDLVEASWRLEQWDIARAAMSLLDEEVPYIIAPGNHDYGRTYEERNSRSRTTHLDTYFPKDLFLSMPTFGGFYEDGARTDNSYQVFEHAGQRWLVLALEFGPRMSVLTWANAVLADHPDHLAIVVTHAYLYPDGARYDWERLGEAQLFNPKSYPLSDQGSSDGQDLWDTVVRRHANVVAVLCGHALEDGLGYTVSYGLGEVHEILTNYQMNKQGGGGYLRLMQFDTATSQVQVSTYSPWRDDYKRDPDNEFELDYSSHVTR